MSNCRRNCSCSKSINCNNNNNTSDIARANRALADSREIDTLANNILRQLNGIQNRDVREDVQEANEIVRDIQCSNAELQNVLRNIIEELEEDNENTSLDINIRVNNLCGG